MGKDQVNVRKQRRQPLSALPVSFSAHIFVGGNHMKKINTSFSVRKMTVTAIMSAASFVLMLLEFATPITPAFLKFDFSDLPALITALSLGPVWGAAVELTKNLLHMPFSGTACIGELANFLVGTALVVPAGIVYRRVTTRKGALVGCLCGAVTSAVLSFPVNYFITYPFYASLMSMEAILDLYRAIIPAADTLPRALLIVNVPFTLVKALCCTVITFAVYKRLSPILKGGKAKPKAGKSEI